MVLILSILGSASASAVSSIYSELDCIRKPSFFQWIFSNLLTKTLQENNITIYGIEIKQAPSSRQMNQTKMDDEYLRDNQRIIEKMKEARIKNIKFEKTS